MTSTVSSAASLEVCFGTYPLNASTNPLDSFPISKTNGLKLNKVHYLLCNEIRQEELLKAMANDCSRDNGVHFGFSCWMNFELIAIRKSKMAIICDIDPEMIALLDVIRDCLVSSNNPAEFVQMLWKDLSATEDEFEGVIDGAAALNQKSFEEKVFSQGWLSSDDSYNYIKNLYVNNCIIHRILDVTDVPTKDSRESFSDIKVWANKQNVVFDTIYVSNIVEWVANKKTQMNSNLENLIDSQTVVISAWKQKNQTKFPPALYWETGIIPSS